MLRELLMSNNTENHLFSKAQANAQSLEVEIAWFSKVLETRLHLYFGHETDFQDIHEHIPPDLTQDGSEYATIVKECKMSFDERIVLILALLPHVRPQVLDYFVMQNKNKSLQTTRNPILQLIAQK